MNYKFYVNGGGLFSRLLQCAIIPLADIQFDDLYLTAWPLPQVNEVEDHVKPGIAITNQTAEYIRLTKNIDPWDTIFNFVLDQFDNNFVDGGLLPVGKFYDHRDRIEHSNRFADYKQIWSKLKVKKELIEQASNTLQNQTDVLGVHIRLKDANSVTDPQTFQNYIDAIEYNLKNYNYSKIFVAADNSISISKLEQLYPGMIIANQLHRSDNESADSFIWEFRNCFNDFYWTDSMIDCLTLSQCKTLICKNSNFSNAAILFGQFADIHRLTRD